MAGLHCSDCVFSSFSFNEHAQKYQGFCSRGYTLAVPHVYKEPDRFFTENINELVPVTDPYGAEYLRKGNVCNRFSKPGDNSKPKTPSGAKGTRQGRKPSRQ